MTLHFKYKEWNVEVEFAEYYSPNNTAISLRDTDNKELITTATTNTGRMLPDGTVAIKNWSENSGLDDDLVEAGILQKEPIGYIPSGMVEVPIYELTIEANTERIKQLEGDDN